MIIKTGSGRIWSLVVFSLMALPVAADEIKGLELATASLRQFAGVRGLDFNAPSEDFVGFYSVETAQGAQVEIFSRWAEDDAWVDGYLCKNTESGADCLKTSGQPRCFYFPETGGFSIADSVRAAELALESWRGSKNPQSRLQGFKFWQVGRRLYGKLFVAGAEIAPSWLAFGCVKDGATLQCAPTLRTENEP